jgi:hypothetical protein
VNFISHDYSSKIDQHKIAILKDNNNQLANQKNTIQVNHQHRCNNFPVYHPDVYLQLIMFRAFSRTSSGAQLLQWQPLDLYLLNQMAAIVLCSFRLIFLCEYISPACLAFIH